MQEVKVTVEDGIKELVIREGQALAIRDKTILIQEGVLGCVAEYIAKRSTPIGRGVGQSNNEVSGDTSVIIFDVHDMSIKLIANQYDPYSPVITGKLKMNPDLQEFQINSERMMDTKELAKFLRMRKAFFKDKDRMNSVIERLMDFRASIDTKIESSNTLKGAQKESFETKLANEIDLDFDLSMPIFRGGQQKSFKVEVMCNVTDGSIRFWLESTDLQNLILTDREELIYEQIKGFRGAGLICIEK